MRTDSWLCLFVLMLAACTDDARPVARVAGSRPERVPTVIPVSPPHTEAPAPGGSIPEVAVAVVDSSGAPIVGRSIVIADARGKTSSILTDDGGTVHFEAVLSPYDLAVAPAPAGSIVVPVVYLGLTRSDPRIALVEGDGAPPRPSTQTLRFATRLPPCVAARCWISVVTASPSGSGATACAYAPGDPSPTFAIAHNWKNDVLTRGETIDVHVLVGDEGYSQFAYGHLSGTAAAPGESTELETIAPEVVAATSSTPIEATFASILPSWKFTLATSLDLPGGGHMLLQYVDGPVLVTRLPRIDGASVEVSAWAQSTDDAWPPRQRSSFATSGPAPLGASELPVDLPAPPEFARPHVDGTLGRRGVGLAWATAPAGAMTLSLEDVARGTRDFRVHLDATSLRLTRLTRLGLALPLLGGHVLEATGHPGRTVDDLVDPRASPRSPAVTFQRFSFTVTP